MLAVDGLNQINQHYGYDVGDKVLVHFAYLLHQTFVGDDVVGRWGGRLFIVAMYGLGFNDGLRRLSNLRQQLSQVPLPAGGRQKQRSTIHFSAGLVAYPPDPLSPEWPAADWSTLVVEAIQQLEQAELSSSNLNNREN